MPDVPVPQAKLAVVCSRQNCHMREDLRAARREVSKAGLALGWLGVGLLIAGLVVLLSPPQNHGYRS